MRITSGVVRARKHLGQHFLHHRRILERIADALGAPAGASVLEIGPGQGSLTRVLVERGFRVTAIEKDPELAALVRERLPEARVVVGDALDLDWASTAEPTSRRATEPPGFYVIGNIPYNITSPLVGKALTPPLPLGIVLLVQEEVADRITAVPGGKAYGGLSVGVQAVARVRKLFRVPAGAFHPRPKVDSAVIRMEPLERSLVPLIGSARFRKLVTGLFGFRRKQLGRGIRELTGLPPERVSQLLGRLGIDPAARPEQLSPEQFVELDRALIDAGAGNR